MTLNGTNPPPAEPGDQTTIYVPPGGVIFAEPGYEIIVAGENGATITTVATFTLGDGDGSGSDGSADGDGN
jgi:hypothetical protein